jgi:hypothetical protein
MVFIFINHICTKIVLMYWVDSARMLNLVMKLICFLFFNIIRNFMKSEV